MFVIVVYPDHTHLLFLKQRRFSHQIVNWSYRVKRSLKRDDNLYFIIRGFNHTLDNISNWSLYICTLVLKVRIGYTKCRLLKINEGFA